MNALENFLSLTKEEMFDWIKSSHEIYLTGGFDSDISKAMIEQEILYWLDENNASSEAEVEIFNYLDSLSE